MPDICYLYCVDCRLCLVSTVFLRQFLLYLYAIVFFSVYTSKMCCLFICVCIIIISLFLSNVFCGWSSYNSVQ